MDPYRKHPSSDLRPTSKPSPPPSHNQSAPNYTLIIRLPFPRGNFEDPPQVAWDATKDRALWDLISAASTSKETVDWEAVSLRFDVPVEFLRRQAAWLYERRFEGMRKLVVGERKEGGNDSPRPSSILASKKDDGAGDAPPTPRMHHPGIERTPSATTVTQSRVVSSSSRQPAAKRQPGSRGQPLESSQDDNEDDDDDDDDLGQDSESGLESAPPARSQQTFRRQPPSTKKPLMHSLSSAEEEDNSEDSLPFASKPAKEDLVSTLKHPTQQPESSSDSSAYPQSSSRADASTRHRAQLSPGSEGSPSMGSSFSDLDDMSGVGQSALEEAVLSTMQRRGSRVGRLREALGRR